MTSNNFQQMETQRFPTPKKMGVWCDAQSFSDPVWSFSPVCRIISTTGPTDRFYRCFNYHRADIKPSYGVHGNNTVFDKGEDAAWCAYSSVPVVLLNSMI